MLECERIRLCSAIGAGCRSHCVGSVAAVLLSTGDAVHLRTGGRQATETAIVGAAKTTRLLSGFGVVSIGLRDQGGDKSAEQGLSAAAGVMHELEGAEIERQLLL